MSMPMIVGRKLDIAGTVEHLKAPNPGCGKQNFRAALVTRSRGIYPGLAKILVDKLSCGDYGL
jgi:hypothetical protein